VRPGTRAARHAGVVGKRATAGLRRGHESIVMPSAFEDSLAKLISRIDDLATSLANVPAAREQLTSLKRDAQSFGGQAVSEYRRTEFADGSRLDRESYNKVLFDQSHQPIAVVDPESGYFIDANRAAAKIFGYSSPQEIVGKTPLDMAAPTQHDGTDSARASRRHDQSALLQGLESFEWRHRRPNGDTWDAMVHLMAFSFHGRRLLQATLEDITERKKTEEALRESRQLLESVLENSPAVIYAKRKDGRYTYINREWERVCDLRRQEVIGKTDQDLFPPKIAEQFRSNDLAVLETGRLTESEERVGTPWGERLFLSRKVPLFSPTGEVEGLCGISTDITERRRNEVNLREAITTLERERENKLMNVEAIIASIAHEIRQPLSAITMNAAAALRFLARTTPDLDEAHAALTRVVGESRRASEVFDGIRDLFRKVGQSREPVDINELIGDALQSLLAEVTDNGVVVRTQLEPGLPLVDGHKAQLQEVITNIVHNAIEAMRSTTDREVLIETKRHQEAAIAVDVEDTGPGVEPKLLHTIFDAFVTTKAEGMGLGLAICRRIVEAHDGQLFAVSDGKRGARFQIILPIRSAASDPATGVAP
jgi:PAS domain S-box-containing protein